MKSLLIKPNANLKKALKQLTKAGEKCLVVVGKKNRLLGKIGLYIMKKYHSFEVDNLDDIRLINNLKIFFNSK